MIKEKSFREILNEPPPELSLIDKIISYIILLIYGYAIISTLFILNFKGD